MDDGIVSKTKRKQEMTALQSLGARLVDLPESQIAELPMEERLREAVLEAKRITSHEAKRRQMQYVGRLMREIDPAPLRERLEAMTGHSAQAAARFVAGDALRFQDRGLQLLAQRQLGEVGRGQIDQRCAERLQLEHRLLLFCFADDFVLHRHLS